MSQHIRVAPEIIAWARDRSGHPRVYLEKHFPNLEKWESGELAPTFKELENFASKTHTPLGNFFLSEPPTIDLSVPDFRTWANVVVQEPSPDLVDTIAICKSRQEWFRDYALANQMESVTLVGSVTTHSDAIRTGAHLRSLLEFEVEDRGDLAGLDDVYRRLSERLDELGILVMKNGIVGLNTHRKLNPQEFRGFALVDAYAPLIFVNGADVKAAHIFTLCHEFIHIAIGASALTNAAPPEVAAVSDTDNAIERWCNQVAAEILVPQQDLIREFDRGQPLERETHRLSRRYKVSKHVILHSLKDARQIGWQVFLEAYRSLQDAWGDTPKVKQKGGGDFYRNQVVRVGRRLSEAIIADTLEGRTLYSEAYRLLGSYKHSTFVGYAKELGLQ